VLAARAARDLQMWIAAHDVEPGEAELPQPAPEIRTGSSS
jgi:hypothetical protein